MDMSNKFSQDHDRKMDYGMDLLVTAGGDFGGKDVIVNDVDCFLDNFIALACASGAPASISSTDGQGGAGAVTVMEDVPDEDLAWLDDPHAFFPPAPTSAGHEDAHVVDDDVICVDAVCAVAGRVAPVTDEASPCARLGTPSVESVATAPTMETHGTCTCLDGVAAQAIPLLDHVVPVAAQQVFEAAPAVLVPAVGSQDLTATVGTAVAPISIDQDTPQSSGSFSPVMAVSVEPTRTAVPIVREVRDDGCHSPKEMLRRYKVARYLAKKAKRKWTRSGKPLYQGRKHVANIRPRHKGRFMPMESNFMPLAELQRRRRTLSKQMQPQQQSVQ